MNSVVAERFNKTLENKTFRYMTAILKDKYINMLNNIVDKYSNTYRKTIKVKFIDVRSSAHINYDILNGVKNPNFKVFDHVSVSKYKSFAAKYSRLVR